MIVDELIGLEIRTILCSPYPRAVKTIMPFSEVSGLKVEVEGCLAEGQLVLDTALEGQPPEYVDTNGYPVKGETREQFIGRAKQAAELILKQDNDRVLVVSHGHLIRELLNIFLKTPNKIRFPHDNCGLSYVTLVEPTIVHYANRALGANKALQQTNH